jgi:hypothetical protein
VAHNEMIFETRQDWWFSSGGVGLYTTLQETPQIKTGKASLFLGYDSVKIAGETKDLVAALDSAYQITRSRYFNVTGKNPNPRIYYDEKSGKVGVINRPNQSGLSLLLSAAPLEKNLPKEKKVSLENLKQQHPELIPSLECIPGIEEIKKPVLVCTPEEIQNGPKIDFDKLARHFQKPRKYQVCSVCGQTLYPTEEVNGTVYPMALGSSGTLSFNSDHTTSVNHVCWACSFLGKFVPAAGFFSMAAVSNDPKGRIFGFLPYASDLRTLINYVKTVLKDMELEDEWKNFPQPLGYIQYKNEALFSFLLALHTRTSKKAKAQSGSNQPVAQDDLMKEPEWDTLSDEEIVKTHHPIQFYTIVADKFGRQYRVSSVSIVNEHVRLFLLFNYLNEQTSKRGYSLIKWVCRFLVEKVGMKVSTLTRNEILGKVLQGQSILDIATEYAFHVNRKDRVSISDIAKLLYFYEPVIRRTTLEIQDQDRACSLGRQIAHAILQKNKGGKSDIDRLYRARDLDDFYNELIRLQSRYDLILNKQLFPHHLDPKDPKTELMAGSLTKETFSEFRYFCLTAALNFYNIKNNPEEKKEAVS